MYGYVVMLHNVPREMRNGLLLLASAKKLADFMVARITEHSMELKHKF